MPAWSGKWVGGRTYLDDLGRTVYFIERRRRSVRLRVHDELAARAELARFLDDPEGYAVPTTRKLGPVTINAERINAYLASIKGAVADHRKARRSYLLAWGALGLDLRTATRDGLRAALSTFDGGYKGRAEALNAFGRWLVREGELDAWKPLQASQGTQETRAEREAYSIEQLRAAYYRMPTQRMRDLFYLRVSTGMHHTEIAQLKKAKLYRGPLPDKGVGIRTLGRGHDIRGVLQVMHKSRHRHRQPVGAAGLLAALRLSRDKVGIPRRGSIWKAMAPLVPSNLRHTFVTLAGEVGVEVKWAAGGLDRARIAQAIGHREGSTMTADRYDKLQVPPMIVLPLGFPR